LQHLAVDIAMAPYYRSLDIGSYNISVNITRRITYFRRVVLLSYHARTYNVIQCGN